MRNHFKAFLYQRVVEDMGSSLATDPYHGNLLNYSGDINFSALNLFLVGRASPYLHNGTEYHENDNHTARNLKNNLNWLVKTDQFGFDSDCGRDGNPSQIHRRSSSLDATGREDGRLQSGLEAQNAALSHLGGHLVGQERRPIQRRPGSVAQLPIRDPVQVAVLFELSPPTESGCVAGPHSAERRGDGRVRRGLVPHPRQSHQNQVTTTFVQVIS